MTQARNIDRLRVIASLIPDQEIGTRYFERHYPNCAHAPIEQEDIDEFIAQLLSWYLSSIKAKDKEIVASTKLLEEKDARLKDKDEHMAHIYEESKDVLGALRDVARKEKVKDRKWNVAFARGGKRRRVTTRA